jgi:VWFA-related protein
MSAPAPWLLAAVAGLVAVAHGQQPPAQPPATFRTGVDLVEVDVSVLDKDRRPVRGLTRESFTILEDGKPRPVVAFAPVDLVEREAAPTRASWVRDVAPDVTTNGLRPEGRLVVIMFDWSIRFADHVLAKRIATAAVNALGPDDLGAVVFSSGFGNAGTPQNFTADRSRLLASINRPWAVAVYNPPVGPGHDPRNKNDVMIEDPEGYLSGDCYCRACVPETIARVADSVRDVRGRRKTLIFIGTYFRPEESLWGPQSRQGGAPGFLRSPEIAPIRQGVCAAPLQEARERMVRATSLANLTIHTLDPVGLETTLNSPLGGSADGQRERREGLAVPADLTGGRTVMNTETPEAHVPAVLAESGSYYLLAFAPSDPKPSGKLHKIEVKVDRPGVTVRTRSGYVTEPARVTGGLTIGSPETVAALKGIMPRADVPLSVTVAPFAIPGKAESALAIVLGARQQVAAESGAKTATVKLLTAAFGWDGKSADAVDQTIGVTSRPDASGTSRYEVVSRLTVKPGRYEVRVALDAATNQRGSVYTFVDVPDFTKQPLSLSGLILSVSPGISSAGREAFATLLPIVPTTQREFARTDRATAFLQVYQEAGKSPLPAGVTARIADTSDRIVLDQVTALTAERFAGNRGADYRLELPLDRLERGEYLLTIEATRGPQTARRGVRFTVR